MKTAWDEQLRQAGLRVTRPRLSVLDVLAGHPHVDAETIVTAARAAHPSISPQAVARVDHRATVEDMRRIGRYVARQALAQAGTWPVEDRVVGPGPRTIVST